MKEKTIEHYGITERVVSCIHPKKVAVYPELRDPRRIEKAIIGHIKENAVFVKRPLSTDLPVENSGVLVCDFLLSEIRKICGSSLDELLLKSMDDLASKGKLLFYECSIKKFMHHNDIFFRVEFAEVSKSNYPQIVVRVKRLYFEQPLALAEKKKRGKIILDISKTVEEIRARRDAHLKARFGSRGDEVTIEKEILAENRAVRIQEHKALMANLDKNKAPEQPDIKT